MSSSVIVGFKRSPFTIAKKGSLAEARPEDILSQVITDLLMLGYIMIQSTKTIEMTKIHLMKKSLRPL